MGNHRLVAMGLAIMIGCGTTAFAGTETREISERIKLLRDRLAQFRGEGGLIEKDKIASTRNPEELSEQLENRKDARMVVLFHDGVTTQDNNVSEKMSGVSSDKSLESASGTKSPVEIALEKIRSMAEARRNHTKEQKPGTKT
ncbi:MAG: hypothetical protein HQM09_11555 [Candidatus Riflebacteria bacterium]|nr:hypothetical protein [Candidatus Riflebacteria bacterium]